MGYTTSTVHGIEVPDSSEANNVPEDIGKVVSALEAGSLVKRLTGAQIAALTAPQKPAGLVVYNTTTNRLEISDGTNFAGIVAGTPVYAIGNRTSAQSIPHNSQTTLTYTAETDPSSMLNTSTGEFTLPSAGLWLVQASAAMTSVQLLSVRVQVDAVTQHTAGTNPAGGYASTAVCDTIVYAASAGAVVRAQLLQVNASFTAADCPQARMSVVKLGA